MASHGADTAFLKFSNVKKTYDQQTRVVKDFSLDVARGEFITLLGPSGSGKTTCLMMLAGFEDVTSGEILIRQVVLPEPEGPSREDIEILHRVIPTRVAGLGGIRGAFMVM